MVHTVGRASERFAWSCENKSVGPPLGFGMLETHCIAQERTCSSEVSRSALTALGWKIFRPSEVTVLWSI